jgi:hypothetical protein
MAHRYDPTCGCDHCDPTCPECGAPLCFEGGEGMCKADCGWVAPEERDADYERAASRARGNDFEDTGGRDWT